MRFEEAIEAVFAAAISEATGGKACRDFTKIVETSFTFLETFDIPGPSFLEAKRPWAGPRTPSHPIIVRPHVTRVVDEIKL
jgi:hypothetical protein